MSGLIHRDIVDDILNECRKREKRSRLLPAHVVVSYVLALNLFFSEAYEEVMRQLVPDRRLYQSSIESIVDLVGMRLGMNCGPMLPHALERALLVAVC